MNKIKIKIKGFDSKVVDHTLKSIITDIEKTGSTYVGPVIIPNKTSRFCVLRGPHIDARSKEHFQMTRHCRVIIINDLNQKTIESLTHLQIPSGVSVEIK